MRASHRYPERPDDKEEQLPDIAPTKAVLPRICRSYAVSCMDTGLVPIVEPGTITATEAVIGCSALLRAVDSREDRERHHDFEFRIDAGFLVDQIEESRNLVRLFASDTRAGLLANNTSLFKTPSDCRVRANPWVR